jgi:hypothetical protein
MVDSSDKWKGRKPGRFHILNKMLFNLMYSHYGRFATIKYVLMIIAACLLCIQLFIIPAFSSRFIFTTDKMSNLGTAISGLTAPIIGIVSIALLYVTLNNQLTFNKAQNDSYEFDMILRLIDELSKEIDEFTFPDYQITGYPSSDGLANCLKCVRNEKDLPGFSIQNVSRELNMIIDLSVTLNYRIIRRSGRRYSQYAHAKLHALMHERFIGFLKAFTREMRHVPATDKGLMNLFECLSAFDEQKQTWKPGTKRYSN